jgi:hypothetical protein
MSEGFRQLEKPIPQAWHRRKQLSKPEALVAPPREFGTNSSETIIAPHSHARDGNRSTEFDIVVNPTQRSILPAFCCWVWNCGVTDHANALDRQKSGKLRAQVVLVTGTALPCDERLPTRGHQLLRDCGIEVRSAYFYMEHYWFRSDGAGPPLSSAVIHNFHIPR